MTTQTIGPGTLTTAFQEVLTIVVRLRSGRQPVSDGPAFRTRITQLLARGEQDAMRMGFGAQDARLAVFAVTAFADESVLNARIPELTDWARRPLQDELFGGHMGGEWFFQHMDQLLARPDAADMAGLLELHQLCLLLGFRGKYGTGDSSPIHAVTARVAERLSRLWPLGGDLAPQWQPPDDKVNIRDSLLRPLTIAAIASLALLCLAWAAYALSLRSSINNLRASAPMAVATASTPALPNTY